MARTSYNRDNLLPEVAQLLEASRAAKPPDGPRDVQTLRSFDLASAAYFGTGAPPIALEREIRIPGPTGDLRAMMWAPVAEPSGLPVVLQMHGGGFVFMLPESFARPSKEMAITAEAIVISLDYRLAPEHPYPAALDDCVAVFRWLRAHAGELGGDPARIAIAGESAGGGLAASTTLRLLAEGEAEPAGLAVMSGWLDLKDSSPSFQAFGPDDPFIDTATMAYWRECYAPDPAQWLDPMLSPVVADVAGFPPTCIVVGGIEPLYDDGVTFAERLRDAGVEVELHEYEGMPHIFWCFPPIAGLTDAVARTGAFLHRVLHT